MPTPTITPLSNSHDHDHNRDHDGDHALDSVNLADHPDTYQAMYWAAYDIARAIRNAEGTIHNAEAELIPDVWFDRVDAWAKAREVNGEDLWLMLAKYWPDTSGPHKNPLRAAEEAFTAATLFDAPGLLPTERKAATVCRCLAEAVADDGRFFLACRDLGRILGRCHKMAAIYLNSLVSAGILERVSTGSAQAHKAAEFRFNGHYTQKPNNTKTQIPRTTPIPSPLPEEIPVTPVPEPQAVIAAKPEGIGVSETLPSEGGGGGSAPHGDRGDHDHGPEPIRPDLDLVIEAALAAQEAEEATRENRRQRGTLTRNRRECQQPQGIGGILAGMAAQNGPGQANTRPAIPEYGPKKAEATGRQETPATFDPLQGLRPEWTLSQKQRAVAEACKAQGLDGQTTRRHIARLLLRIMRVKESPLAITRVITVYDRVKSWAAVAKAALSLAGEATESKRLQWLEYRARAQAGIA